MSGHSFRVIFILLAMTFVSSCSSIRMGYHGPVKNTDGQELGSFAFEKSYSTSNLQLWCIITGIIYGGACWAYLAMPLTNQRKEFHRDALEKLKLQTGQNNIDFNYDGIKQINWENRDESFTFSGLDNVPVPKTSPVPVSTPASNEKKTIEFLR
jgi:hypothetical protein